MGPKTGRLQPRPATGMRLPSGSRSADHPAGCEKCHSGSRLTLLSPIRTRLQDESASVEGAILSGDLSHIFICFSSKDDAVAREVVAYLEAQGLNCWISLRDVAPGQNYQETIVQALEGASAIVFLFSEFSKASGEIKKELSIGASVNVPVFPLRLSPITPSGALRYELATRQWIDFFPDRQQALGRLVSAIRHSLERRPSDAAGAAGPEGSGEPASGPRRTTVPREPIVAPDSTEFEAIRRLLARHIGPIAKVLVQKAASQARTPNDFCEQLATHVSGPVERAAFLREARAKLAAKS